MAPSAIVGKLTPNRHMEALQITGIVAGTSVAFLSLLYAELLILQKS